MEKVAVTTKRTEEFYVEHAYAYKILKTSTHIRKTRRP
jgi:hypothetical protein